MDPAFRRQPLHAMNLKNLSVVLCPLLAFALPAAAQNPPRLRQMVPPPQPGQPGQPHPQEAAAELPHNVKLTLEGSLFGTIPTDFSVTTCGTTVSTDMVLKSDGPAPTIGTFQAVLTPGEPWQVVVSLGARVPIPTGNGNIEYQDCRLSTTVRIAPGKKVVLWQKGDQKLTLSVEKVEE
jgi:hypothetical protein